jgi:rhodanese-related sulfurtransferase
MQVKNIVESPDEGVVLVGMSAYALVLIDRICPLTVPPPACSPLCGPARYKSWGADGTVFLDVREPAEYAAGFIPSAINIPISSQPEALFLPSDEFKDRFGFTKPPASKEVVFYCKSGVRSAAAAQLARQGGYEKVGEYKGSWLDWERRGGGGQ